VEKGVKNGQGNSARYNRGRGIVRRGSRLGSRGSEMIGGEGGGGGEETGASKWFYHPGSIPGQHMQPSYPLILDKLTQPSSFYG
jgi:hypothetical protein